MKTNEYFATLKEEWRDEIVVCSLGTSSDKWWATTESRTSFYVEAAMGFAASFGLGLAIGCPDERIWVLDGDGALSMNLGGLLTEAEEQPSNLVHIVLNNASYACLGNARLVASKRADYAGIARAAGIVAVHEASTTDELASAIGASMDGYSIIIARVEPDPVDHGFQPELRQPFEGAEAKYIFGRYLEERLGRSIFGTGGY
jgi:phosphonopyruvate decarboxylase